MIQLSGQQFKTSYRLSFLFLLHSKLTVRGWIMRCATVMPFLKAKRASYSEYYACPLLVVIVLCDV